MVPPQIINDNRQLQDMKKVLLLLLCVVMSLGEMCGQSRTVSFEITKESAIATGLKGTIEANVSKLLSAINSACISGSALNLSGISIEANAKMGLESLWQNMHFYCEDDDIYEKCMQESSNNYQVRDIRIVLKPVADYDGNLERELTVSLNGTGQIAGVRMALETNSVSQLFGGNKSYTVKDTRERLEILKFVEDFRCYYNTKNIEALRMVYADDALIITGSVVSPNKEQKGVGIKSGSMVKYRRENKDQYLNRMAQRFANPNYFLDVEFDQITIERNGAKPEYYGVTLHQKWNATGYKDDGWLFLFWDFTDKEKPVIHVRTWQPLDAVKQDGMFDMGDFEIQ